MNCLFFSVSQSKTHVELVICSTQSWVHPEKCHSIPFWCVVHVHACLRHKTECTAWNNRGRNTTAKEDIPVCTSWILMHNPATQTVAKTAPNRSQLIWLKIIDIAEASGSKANVLTRFPIDPLWIRTLFGPVPLVDDWTFLNFDWIDFWEEFTQTATLPHFCSDSGSLNFNATSAWCEKSALQFVCLQGSTECFQPRWICASHTGVSRLFQIWTIRIPSQSKSYENHM